MSDSLDLQPIEFKALLDKSSELVLRKFEALPNQKGYQYFEQKEVASWFNEALPLDGMDDNDLLDYVEEKVMNTATGNMGQHMYAYVMAGGNQMGIIAEKLAATVNQNVAKWHLAPAMSEIEKRVIQWTSDMIGYGESIGGVMVSGGSAANFAGLTVARNLFFEHHDIRKKGLFQMKPFIVYTSEETHNSVDKSVDLLGIGTDQIRKISTNADFTINMEALEAQITKDIAENYQPFCIIANAGTVNTGAIDDLTALAELSRKYELWFHVDGAYGGLASSLASKEALYKGMELADSLALDFHKWLYQPFEAGCLLVKNWERLKQSYFTPAAYLDNSLEKDQNRLEFNEHYFQLSRNAKALKVWMSIKSYGINKIKTMIHKDIDLTEYLNQQIRNSEDFILRAESPLAVSCFQYVGQLKDRAAIIDLNQRLIPALEKDGNVFITGTRLKGEFVLRACLINHRKDMASVDFLLETIRNVAKTL